jgi:DNA-binding transcriptional LysR family regulator
MELTQLRYFVMLAMTKNFSRAAEELFITQPTLSQQIKRLEKDLGAELFHRSTRSVTLTPAGEMCLPYAQKAMDAVSGLANAMQEEKRRANGRLLVGVLTVYPHLNVSSILAKFQAMHPEMNTGVRIDWSVELLNMLLQKKVDVIISNVALDLLEPEVRELLRIHVFLEDWLHVVLSCRHPLAERESVTIEDIRQETIFHSDPRSSAKVRFENAVIAKGYSLPVFNTCPSMTSTFNFVENGMGISVMTRHVAMGYMTPGVTCIPITPKIRTQTAIITRRSVSAHPILQEFQEFFLQNIANA